MRLLAEVSSKHAEQDKVMVIEEMANLKQQSCAMMIPMHPDWQPCNPWRLLENQGFTGDSLMPLSACMPGVHACRACLPCSLDAFLVPEDKGYRHDAQDSCLNQFKMCC